MTPEERFSEFLSERSTMLSTRVRADFVRLIRYAENDAFERAAKLVEKASSSRRNMYWYQIPAAIRAMKEKP